MGDIIKHAENVHTDDNNRLRFAKMPSMDINGLPIEEASASPTLPRLFMFM